MSKEKQHILPRQKVLNALQDGVRTWDELRSRTKLNDDGLGFALGELLNLRKIWTANRGSIRVYGIEKRTDLVPRFSTPKRRSTDDF